MLLVGTFFKGGPTVNNKYSKLPTSAYKPSTYSLIALSGLSPVLISPSQTHSKFRPLRQHRTLQARARVDGRTEGN